MDTERYQALMDRLEQIKARADECQDDLREGNEISFRLNLTRIIQISYKATDDADEVFRAEEVNA